MRPRLGGLRSNVEVLVGVHCLLTEGRLSSAARSDTANDKWIERTLDRHRGVESNFQARILLGEKSFFEKFPLKIRASR